MPNSAATSASCKRACKRMVHVASAAALTAAAIAAALALTFPTYSWGTSTSASESEGTATSASASSPIKLVQLERSANGDSLGSLVLKGDFLLPAVGGIASANGELVLDDWGMPASSAFVDMIVGATNCSKAPETNDGEPTVSAASETTDSASKTLYTRVLVAVPAALETLDDPATADIDESQSSPLHLVDGSLFAYSDALDDGLKTGASKVTNPILWSTLWTHEINPGGAIEIESVTYNVHMFTYKVPLEPGETTQLPAIVGFYLDPNVNYDHTTQCLTYNGMNTELVLLTGDLGIPVSAQAVEADTFESATTAFATHNPGTNPWDGSEGFRGLLKRLFRILGIN